MKMSNYELSMLAIIRDEVDDYLNSENFRLSPEKSNILPTLTRILPKIAMGKSFTVVLNKSSREPFVMAIFPDIQELDKKSKELADILNDPSSRSEDYVKSWCEIKNWVLEIDERILLKDSPICVRSGSEFVALICHEIGHVMVEDPLTLVYNYKKKMAVLSKFDKIVSSENKFVRRMMLPMFINTLSFRIVSKGDSNLNLDKEISADAYVPEGYRASLIGYMNQCIYSVPPTSSLFSTKSQYDNEQESSMKFSKESISMIKNRRDVLKHQLNAQYNGCQGSEYMKSLTKLLAKTLGNYDAEKDKTDIIRESTFVQEYSDSIQTCEQKAEALVESVKVSDRDLTILEVQCQNVKTTEDKIYLIHTIYDFIEAITKENSAKLKKTADPKVKEFIANDSRLSRLNACRELVMKTDTTDVGDRYGLFIKYPKGYEG